ncbi:hypothetical protein [Nguyenibacter vanlangensis]|uniref:Uncharacterized protein n=1 Tax=Nguyenibacter vanlangensis TaxID=1216886 RepID=A0A7Y7M5P4_9PROT|nr:hypothetical protein [Nguyenibacter vanlangensis]NVN09713.1 hypothetical protein [Nguyenibacter vanlangensis]
MATKIIRGGDTLRRTLQTLAAKVDRGATLKVGFFEDATYGDGTPVAAVGAYNEFGTRTIPPRPFMRNMVANNQDQWGRLLGATLKATGMDAEQALDMAGEKLVAQMQKEIQALQDPPLAPSTIESRLRSDKKRGTLKTVNMATAVKPLIDTGHMLNSVAKKVESK